MSGLSSAPDPGAQRADAHAPAASPDDFASCPTEFQPGLPADRVDAGLRAAVRDLECAEHRAVLWFADMNARRLYRDFGYASMRQYATSALGFSRTRTADFTRLAARLDELPRIRESIAAGDLGYTKARELIKVASPDTEQQWLETAASTSRRDLEARVKRVRKRAQRRRQARAAAQPELTPAQTPPAVADDGLDDAACAEGTLAGATPADDTLAADIFAADTLDDALADAAPATVSLRLTAVQLACYDELWRRLGAAPNAHDLLAALAALLAERGPRSRVKRCDRDDNGERVPRGTLDDLDSGTTTGSAAGATGAASDDSATRAAKPHGLPPFQIHLHRCPGCGSVETAGGRTLDRADRQRSACDAAIAAPGRRNTTTIPPRVRREVLARDRHRCQAPGCENTRFLEIHHRVPRARGGDNDPANLVTLCSACHRLWHERATGRETETQADRSPSRPGGEAPGQTSASAPARAPGTRAAGRAPP